MSVKVSFTYRPAEGLLPPITDFQKMLQSISTIINYYIGAESAGKEQINHYQCFLESKARLDNVSRTLKKKLKELVPGDENMEVSVKVSSIKPQDVEYVLGYCQKEKHEFRTNILSNRLEEAVKAHDLREVVKTKAKHEKTSIGIDQIFRMLLEVHQQKKLKSFDEYVFKNFIRTYSKEISYTTRQKLRVETLGYHITLELEDEKERI